MNDARKVAWQALGAALAARRPQIAYRYYERSAFARDTGLNYRFLLDLENAKQPGREYTHKKIHDVEIAYRLPAGSIARFVDNGAPLPPVPQPEPEPDPNSRAQPEPEPGDLAELIATLAPDDQQLARDFIEAFRVARSRKAGAAERTEQPRSA